MKAIFSRPSSSEYIFDALFCLNSPGVWNNISAFDKYRGTLFVRQTLAWALRFRSWDNNPCQHTSDTLHQQTKCQIFVHVTAEYVTSATQAPRCRPRAAKPQLAVHLHHNSMFCLTVSHRKRRATPRFVGPVFFGSSPLLLCFAPIKDAGYVGRFSGLQRFYDPGGGLQPPTAFACAHRFYCWNGNLPNLPQVCPNRTLTSTKKKEYH
jgi:hypothetical protein